MRSFFASSALLATTLFSAVRAYPSIQQYRGQSLAVYWGQGSNQKSLAYFCADSTIDIIPIGFVNVFPDQNGTYGYPGTNFGNACGGYYVDSKNETTQLLGSCPQIAADIAYCQSQGKKILLSLGGGSTGVFVASDASATSFADFLYGAFGPSSPSWTGPRPFGNASVDGFDFDIEASASAIPTALGFGYATMVNHLRTLGKMFITASPQCIVPDANLGNALANAYFDAIFVQFYNTPQCSARAYFDNTYGAYGGPATDISYDAWISWVQANASNPHALVYLGLPAAPGATFGEMYLNTTEAQEILTNFQSKYPSQFGGAMLWEATFSDNNQVNGMSYAANIKCFLTGSCTATSTTSSTPSSTPSNSANGTFSIPTVSPTGTGYPGSIPPTGSGYPTGSGFPTGSTTPTGSGYPAGGPTVSQSTTASVTGSTSTWPTGGGNTYTGAYTGSSSVSPVTVTDRYGSTFTYTPTNIQPSGVSTYTTTGSFSSDSSTAWSEWDPTVTSTSSSSSSLSTSWDPWDPSTTAAPASASSSSTFWDPWDPSTTASPVSTSSLSTSWAPWDPSTTASPVSTSSSSTSWGEWDPWTTATSTSTQTWEKTITASDAVTVTIMPLPATTPASRTIASWSSYWTQRASFSSFPSSESDFQPSSVPAAPASTDTSTSSSAWSFTGWSQMPSYTTLAPLPSIATVTAATSASAGTAGWSTAAAAAASTATAGPSIGVYVQPFTAAGSVAQPVFGVLAAMLVAAAALLI